MKQKKVQKGRLFRVIGLYFLCLLAAFFTWVAVMYTEEKNAAADGKSEETLFLLPYDDGTKHVAVSSNFVV